MVKELKVVEEKPEIPDDNEESNSSNDMELIQLSGVVAVIVVVLILLFLYYNRRGKTSSENERTAKKLPMDDRRGNYGRVSPRGSRYGKTTARKIRMDSSGRQKGKGRGGVSDRGRDRYNQRYSSKRKR